MVPLPPEGAITSMGPNNASFWAWPTAEVGSARNGEAAALMLHKVVALDLVVEHCARHDSTKEHA